LAVEAPSVPPAVAVEAVVETVLEALPAALPVAPDEQDEQDEQDDEPPPADDYYEVDMDTLAYLDAAPEPDVVVVEEPLPAAKPATGLAAEWLELFPRLGLGGLTASIGANCTLVAADDDHWHLHLDPGQSALFNATQQRRLNDALNQHLGRTLKLEVTLQKPEQ
ncbi:TPA: DNA polymerase III subunit gamma/tau, partial [Pseudomonas aeruginosa]|nr:DNA polymerase III subunit gamma/tau [Pseudomonas aeruginosa]